MNNKIPIIILSYNRIDCLYLTISTLLSFIDKDRYKILIWDDCSTDKRISKWLNGKNVSFSYDYSTLTNFLKRIGYKEKNIALKRDEYQLPNIDEGLIEFHINEENLFKGFPGNYMKNGAAAINFAKEKFNNSEFIHIIENDVIVCKETFELSEKISLEETKIGCVQCGRSVSTRLFKNNRKFYSDIEISDSDGSGSQQMCLNKKSILAMENLLNKSSYNHGFDWSIHHWLYENGFRVVNFTNKSLYLHIGMNTSFNNNKFEDNMTFNPDFEKLKIVGL